MNKIVGFLISCVPLTLYAQGTDNYKVDLPSMPYLSPEAASLGKYGEITVSESTRVA